MIAEAIRFTENYQLYETDEIVTIEEHPAFSCDSTSGKVRILVDGGRIAVADCVKNCGFTGACLARPVTQKA